MISRRQFNRLACSAAALATTTPAFASVKSDFQKRGCAFTTKNGNGWRDKIELLNPSWMYSWGSNLPENMPSDVDFTPMLWNGGSDKSRAKIISQLKLQAERGEINHLLGFNEPDQKEQANMSVERVVEIWPELMEIGVPLISPGCVHPDREWMHQFMNEVEKKNLRVDAISVHSYGGPSAEHLVKRLKALRKEFGRAIWITEFAVGDWEAKTPEQNRHRPERVASFMKEVLPALDRLRFVERYAWFSASQTSNPLGTSALFDAAGDLTPLGEIYASHKSRKR